MVVVWAVAVAARHLQRGAEQLQILAHHPHLRLHRLLRRRAVRPLLTPRRQVERRGAQQHHPRRRRRAARRRRPARRLGAILHPHPLR